MVLTVVYPGVGEVSGPAADATLTVDIIIIHGLNGSATNTWTNADTKAFWPKDFLPFDIPEARVITFGYNANAAFGNTTTDIVDHAKELLSGLMDKREEDDESQRPIIFIAHSLGGIVVKQALFLARVDPQYSSINQHTIGIIFFGTPHCGSDIAAYGKILAKVATTVMNKPSSKLLGALRSNSDALARLTSDFKHQLPQYQIVSFYETKPMGIFKKLIVERHSALLEVPGEDQVPVDANHRDMCKFSTRKDEHYEKLFKRIRRILKEKSFVQPSAIHPCNKHYNVPHNVSAAFTGRDDVCTRLRESCLPPHALMMQRRFVLYGLGGSGKTQVSLKFAHDNRESFWGVFWIDCSSNQTIEQGFLKIARICKLEEDFESVRIWLSSIQDPWLLLLDNADDPAIDISRCFPAGSQGTILITTRNPDCVIHATAGSYEFAAMDVDEAITLLLKICGSDDTSLQTSRATARSIVTTLGGLALAIIQAGIAIRQKLCRMEEYCDVYQRRRKELLSRAPAQASADYKYTVYTTWEVSVNMIKGMGSETSNHALDLLRLFSFLHFDGISVEIFKQAWTNMRCKPRLDWTKSYQLQWLFDSTSSDWDPFPFQESVVLLSSFSLIGVDGSNNISMHPLVHAWSRDTLNEAEQSKWWAMAASTLAMSICWRYETFDYNLRRSLVPHINSCLQFPSANILFTEGDTIEERLEIVVKFARAYEESSLWTEATNLSEKVLEIRSRTLGEGHPDTLKSMNNLARCYNSLGQISEALQLGERALEMTGRILGEEHVDSLTSMHGLANSYEDHGWQQKTLKLREKVVEVRRKTLGEEHIDTTWAMNNLAISYSDFCRQQEALKLREAVLEARRRILSEDHPDTLSAMYSLALSYDDLGRQQEALKLRETVLEARRRILGEDHLDTLWAKNSLANSYEDLGRQQEALKLRETVLEARRRILGEDHLDTLSAMHGIACTFNKLGRHEEALKLWEAVLEARRKILGEDHLETLSAIYGIACTFNKLGRHQEALKLWEAVLEARRKILGEDHPETLSAIYGLAFTYNNLGRHQEALKLDESVLEARRRILGEDHLDTLSAMNNLAVSYSDLGRQQEALKLWEAVLEARRRILGEDHPDTLSAMKNLAI